MMRLSSTMLGHVAFLTGRLKRLCKLRKIVWLPLEHAYNVRQNKYSAQECEGHLYVVAFKYFAAVP